MPNWRQLAASTAELLAASLGLGSVDRSDAALLPQQRQLEARQLDVWVGGAVRPNPQLS